MSERQPEQGERVKLSKERKTWDEELREIRHPSNISHLSRKIRWSESANKAPCVPLRMT